MDSAKSKASSASNTASDDELYEIASECEFALSGKQSYFHLKIGLGQGT